ncbi:2OG-Fe(II) oxygenase [Flammeovirgaceae bacterium SG7u.111]|nr:2OG-Fe(II) oxygenase [Flammeovirgaceae bacterium SG7u.132]WPO36837.1 2OG-Fe(II) oxygenase [Flammeovirgaceae bacterium SG7u.111]
MEFYSEEQWIDWVDKLAEDNHLVIDNFLPSELFKQLERFMVEKIDQDRFEKAGIGAETEFQIKSEIRGDFTFWIEKKRDTVIQPFFTLAEEIVAKLNRYCFLSLSGYEFHLAHYPKGSFYKKHLDQFNHRSNRMVSVIIYFNKDWQKGDGGELKIYDPKGDSIVEPLANRCVIFKSGDVPHEVLITNKGRYSLTGWLLYQPPVLGQLFG